VAEEDWMDVLGVYKWEVWKRGRIILGEGLEDDYKGDIL
jgi:hypothetical protein